MKLKKNQFKKKDFKEKNMSQLGFTLLTYHMRHEIRIKFFKKTSKEKDRS
jgi:hypothetical protein